MQNAARTRDEKRLTTEGKSKAAARTRSRRRLCRTKKTPQATQLRVKAKFEQFFPVLFFVVCVFFLFIPVLSFILRGSRVDLPTTKSSAALHGLTPARVEF